jgi:hypothetical protein
MSRTGPHALLVALLGLGGAALAQEAPAGAPDAASRAAVPPQVEGRGKARAGGLDGSLRVVLAADGRFLLDVATALPERAGFDGTRVWTRDHSGLERVIELEDADRWKVLAWVLSGHWRAADELDVRTEEEGAVVLALRGTPLEMRLVLDGETGLPMVLEHRDDSGPVTWTFTGWREVAGRVLPHRWVFSDGTSIDTFEIDAWRTVAADPASFQAALAPPADVRFDPEVEPELDVVRVATGHLLVEPWVEGESVGMFIFDTGAGAMTIDPAIADELGLAELGEVVAVGVGGKTTTSFRRGTRFELGALTLDDPVYVELDLAFLEPIFGRRIAGIVGYDVLARCVAEIEMRGPTIALHDPRRFTLTGASWQELALNENTPCVRASFEGEREGLFRLDTGANGTVSFHAPAVRALGLLDGRAVTTGSSGGVGGTAETKDGTLEWFELAGERFDSPRVQFSLAEHGAFTDRYTLGNIGQSFLAPFRIVLDYPGDRIAFVPLRR